MLNKKKGTVADNIGLDVIPTFYDAAKATKYLHCLVLLDNTPEVDDFECGYKPTFH